MMASTESENTVWLTQEAYDRLALELEQLTTVGRAEISKRIEIAREEGDLKENGGYHAAKDEQAKMEGRIRNLTDMLKHAVVGDHPASSGVVEPGTVVTAHIHGDEEKFLLVLGNSPVTPTWMFIRSRARSAKPSWVSKSARAAPSQHPRGLKSPSRSST